VGMLRRTGMRIRLAIDVPRGRDFSLTREPDNYPGELDFPIDAHRVIAGSADRIRMAVKVGCGAGAHPTFTSAKMLTPPLAFPSRRQCHGGFQ
jgi:hypothetical protein